jgi:hypothetical protein
METNYIDRRPNLKTNREVRVGGHIVKILLNILNLGTFVLFCVSIVTGIHLERDCSKLGSHLGWVLGTMLLWLFTYILSMMYMYRMEKFCVEIVEKYEEKKGE